MTYEKACEVLILDPNYKEFNVPDEVVEEARKVWKEHKDQLAIDVLKKLGENLNG